MVLLSSTSMAFAQSAKEKKSIEAEVRKLDLAQADANFKGDTAAINSFWPDDFIINNQFNQVDGGERIRKGIVTYSSFIRNIEVVRVHGNTVIVMGNETVVPKGTSPDAGKTWHRRYTDVWMNVKGKWWMVARHAHTVPPPQTTNG
ncbi:nuclear transport factor 2 family protein [Mucilaginibacter sp. OK098]|uniref:nuclear transport factor 2 family protein n=1 Tax=Mucilaginibacter sp. OK098 TaxID=1855297 RepID=UPI0013565DB0|nr:nuclear transport factor 2 family protein [Mucilaginibacter sp. OK098]